MNKEELDWDVRLIDPASYRKEIQQMIFDVFMERVGIDQVVWKYENNPYGAMKVWCAWNKKANEIMGLFSAFKRYFIHEQNKIVVYQAADAVVKAEYRGYGVFRKLMNEMAVNLKSEGALFHFGYTNVNSTPIYKKYNEVRELKLGNVFVFINGFRGIADVLFPTHNKIRKLSAFLLSPSIRLYNRAFHYVMETGYSLAPLSEFDEIVAQWSYNAAKEYDYFPLRDKAFLEWKAIKIPQEIKKDLYTFWFMHDGKKAGYCVLYAAPKTNRLKIIDLLCENNSEYLPGLIQEIKNFAISKRFDAITLNVAGNQYKEAFIKGKFLKKNPVTCMIFCLKDGILKDIGGKEDFWIQLPIDRDNFYY